jgi:hypothetical protein
LQNLQKIEECAMNMKRVLTTIAVAMLLTGCASTDTRAGEDNPAVGVARTLMMFDLLLRVDNDTDLVVTNEASNRCKKFKNDRAKKGCIGALLDETVDTTVKFVGSTGWYFSKFRICRADDNAPQKPGFGPDCTLSDIDRAAWMVQTVSGPAIPGTDGLVDLNPFGDTTFTQFKILDLNLIQANYFYGIEACNATIGECVWTDPGSENNGRNWP